ncbi:hypothetical protein AWL63_16870 [Sphingomonas panacis]|uniref:Uncharacterized protein n=1 Tax=Sphingomonas panacis TaxID=1560345 RepID=A0A1B3ZD61_9SPHN|nr:DUF1178 family protein [Sphingomonas panacis]AOH85366.1 hypothetical protein AWL63_16870 [Sphingomonas panacis]
MIVFDLRCPQSHVFEAWFGSSAAYEDQRTRGLLSCPVCGDAEIVKAVMAPNVSPKGNSRAVAKSDEPPTPAAIKAAMKALAQAQAKALEKSEWVGAAFPERARAMHAGDVPAAPIHGQTSLAEAKSLIEEGVPVAPLPLPIVPPDAVN